MEKKPRVSGIENIAKTPGFGDRGKPGQQPYAEVLNPKEVKAEESITVNVNQPKKPRLDAEAPP